MDKWHVVLMHLPSLPWIGSMLRSRSSHALPRPDGEPITIISLTDEKFVLALAVMVRSILDHYRGDQPLEVIVLHTGLTYWQRHRLRKSWRDSRLRVRFVSVDLRAFAHLPVRGHIRTVTYARWLIPDLLPLHRRALYLDADMLFFADVTELWATDFRGNPAAAVWDMVAGTVTSQYGLPTYKALGIDPSTKVYSDAVFLMDLSMWRKEGLHKQILSYVEREAASNLFCGQDGFNAVLHNRLTELEPAWNVGTIETYYAAEHSRPFSQEDFQKLVEHPRILHFESPDKPWLPGCRHPRRAWFFETVDRTAWRGWRPDKP